MTLPPSLLAWPPEALEEYAERAAIVEVLGKVPRARAEEKAERIVRERYAAAAERPPGSGKLRQANSPKAARAAAS